MSSSSGSDKRRCRRHVRVTERAFAACIKGADANNVTMAEFASRAIEAVEAMGIRSRRAIFKAAAEVAT